MSAGSDTAENVIDPSLRLLSRVADYVEPLTRFDRDHLSLEGSQHRKIEVTARQHFRVTFDFIRSEGNGDLPAGVVAMASPEALAADTEAQLAAARASLPERLAAWATAHGEDSTRRLSVTDCFTATPELGVIEDCTTCKGRGKTACSACNATGVQECPACGGRGSRPCTVCEATGKERCRRCYGQGYEIVHKQETVWDSASNTGRTQNVPHKQTCGGCGGSGSVICGRCGGSRELACSRCSGQRTIPCAVCNGAGTQICAACEGAGHRYRTRRLVCTVKDSFEVSATSPDADIAKVLNSLEGMGEVLSYAEDHRSTAEAGASVTERQTIASIPVTSIVVAIGAKQTLVHGFGPQQDIRDFGDIASLLLAEDLDVLEAALPSERSLFPAVTPNLTAALASTLASEANVAIAENPGKKGLAAVQRDFQGLLSEDHLQRTAASIRKAVGLAYWSSILRGPVALLAMPLLQIPVELLLRDRGMVARLSGMAGVMLIAFGGAILAHMLAVRSLQTRLAPGGTPKLSGIVARQGHLRNWLVGAGVFIVLATTALAGFTNLLAA